jgi:transposase-like protein
MKQLNRYYRCAKISERKTRQIIKYFALDLTANKTAQLVAMTHQSVNRIFLKIRSCIAEEAERASPFASCEVEVDESYFGARRVKGKRGRGAGGKTKVFGIFKRNGSVYTEIVPDCSKKTLQAVFAGVLAWTQLFTRTNGAATTDWLMSDIVSIFALIIRLMNSSMVTRTLTE